MTRRLYRSSKDRMVAGVCGGLGEYLDIDPTLIRLLFVAAVLAGFGSGILLYLVLMIVMPLGNGAPLPNGALEEDANGQAGQETADNQVDQEGVEPTLAEAELEESVEPDKVA
ncbi:MAG: PspC domain-containing protein [Thermoflexales bacterium]|nr:PspC domain-containing protein [Thermoflexales bacterium]